MAFYPATLIARVEAPASSARGPATRNVSLRRAAFRSQLRFAPRCADCELTKRRPCAASTRATLPAGDRCVHWLVGPAGAARGAPEERIVLDEMIDAPADWANGAGELDDQQEQTGASRALPHLRLQR